MYKTTTTPFEKSCTNSLMSHRFEVAYKRPIVEALFTQHIYMRGELMEMTIFI